ncbi:MAG: guanylate kinase [Lachnospiraceae bacterium]|nr:guanylate kinase [Lachnospiraceae bacterium]
MIYFVMGKSSSGKDTIFQKLLQDETLNLKKLVGYSTRPQRANEQNGREYFFVTEDEMLCLEREGKVIERRSYNTVHGIWNYFTVDDGQMQDASAKYLYIGTLESYEKVVSYYGQELVVPIYIEVEDGLRLARAVERERKQSQPKYAELCRRFLADAADFSEENILKCGIPKRYSNNESIEKCLQEIRKDLQ